MVIFWPGRRHVHQMFQQSVHSKQPWYCFHISSQVSGLCGACRICKEAQRPANTHSSALTGLLLPLKPNIASRDQRHQYGNCPRCFLCQTPSSHLQCGLGKQRGQLLYLGFGRAKGESVSFPGHLTDYSKPPHALSSLQHFRRPGISGQQPPAALAQPRLHVAREGWAG